MLASENLVALQKRLCAHLFNYN